MNSINKAGTRNCNYLVPYWERIVKLASIKLSKSLGFVSLISIYYLACCNPYKTNAFFFIYNS
jgi:hypothetical protein